MRPLDPFEGNTFAGGHLDRAGNQRRNEQWVAEQAIAPAARFLPLWQLKAPVAKDGSPALYWLSGNEVRTKFPHVSPIFLGLDDAGAPYFAVDASNGNETPPFDGAAQFEEVRAIAPGVDRGDAALLAQARSLIDWHARHAYCAVCGSATALRDGGYVRRCVSATCGAQHFPRTDPVVIMLIHKDDRCLIGRQKWFPEGFYSTLAGFMEPGETIEEAVRREVYEEARIHVGEVRYHSSQPWPYPSSLMIGCIGVAEDDAIAVDDVELEDACWVDRATIGEAIRRVSRGQVDPLGRGAGIEGVGQRKIKVPAPMAIAHQLMRAWAVDEAG